MAYNDEELSRIYDRTTGYCHLCGRKMCFTNYGRVGARGAWEVEHSKPRAHGGTDHGNNLYGAHIVCNRQKSAVTTRTARSWHGRTRAPLSRDKRAEVKGWNTAGGAAIGGLLGAVAGPVGLLLGALGGAAIGKSIKPH